MDAKKTTAQIDGELEALRTKLRGLEVKKQSHAKAIDKAKAERKRGAFKAHADGDSTAAAALAKARENEIRAVMEMEDIGSAIAEGGEKFQALEAEREETYRRERWEAARAAMRRAQAEAEEIHLHLEAFSNLLQKHDATLSEIRLRGHEAGQSDAAMTRFKLTHITRTLFNFYLKRTFPTGLGVEYSKQYEKPYTMIMAQVVAGAEHKAQPDGQDTVGTEAETEPEAGTEPGAGAEATA